MNINLHVYIYKICVTIIKEKEAMNLKEGKSYTWEDVWRVKRKGEMM